MKKNHKILLIYVTVFATVLVVFIAKGVLLITRYGINISGAQCGNNQSTTGVNHEYVFTVIIYGILSMFRILEYVLLAKQFYTFLFKQDKVSYDIFFTTWDRNICFYLMLFTILLVPYFILGSFAIPALGIYQEINHSERLAHCYGHYHEIYIAYSVVNIFRYMFAFTVRIVMIYCALVLRKIWFPNNGPPLHTSYGLMTTKRQGVVSAVSHAKLMERDAALNRDVTNWKAVSRDWRKRFDDYIEIGKKAEAIQELLQTWFIVPWIVYMIASSLKTYNILRPWNSDGDGNIPPTDIPHIYYLLYNINQFITLIVPYLCAKKINTYHQKYLRLTRNYQLMKFEDDSSRLSMARQLVVIRHPVEKYDFVPRIIGTSITIPIGDPLYIIILLAGIFLSVSESLLN